MISLSRIGRIRTTRCRFRRAKDEWGTMRDELKKEEARRSKRQAGRSRSGLERKPECLGKQKRCQYMIALLRFYSTQTNEVETLLETRIQGLRLQTDGPGRRGISDAEDTPSKQTQQVKCWRINQIDGFQPKQTHATYLPCGQLDTAKFGPVL
jgi:hypothetical protein